MSEQIDRQSFIIILLVVIGIGLFVGAFLVGTNSAYASINQGNLAGGNGGPYNVQIAAQNINNNTALVGAVIKGTPIGSGSSVSCTSGSSGLCVINGVQAGTYTFVGTKLPTGYCSYSQVVQTISSTTGFNMYFSPCSGSSGLSIVESATSPTTVAVGGSVGLIDTVMRNGNPVPNYNVTLIEGTGSQGGINSKLTNMQGQVTFNPVFSNPGTYDMSGKNFATGASSNAIRVTVTGTGTTTVSSTTVRTSTSMTTATISTTITTTTTGIGTTQTSTITTQTTSTVTFTSTGSQSVFTQLATWLGVGGGASLFGAGLEAIRKFH